MRDCFSSCHPAVNAAWFALVLAFTFTTFHPVLLLTALGAGLAWRGRLGAALGWPALGAVFLVAALCNPLFSHEGATILGYFPGGNPLTLESILFGLGAGAMLVCALVWLGCMARVMTADKWMCLLGRAMPALSLLLSMTLRALPRLRDKLEQLRQSQRQVGCGGPGAPDRARAGLRLLGVLASWSLEDALSCADSMDGRGYGLPGRTFYTNYRLDGRDRALLGFLACAGGYLLLMALHGALDWRYYPTVRGSGLDLWSLSAFLDWGCLCALPLYLNWKEAREWTHTGSWS